MNNREDLYISIVKVKVALEIAKLSAFVSYHKIAPPSYISTFKGNDIVIFTELSKKRKNSMRPSSTDFGILQQPVWLQWAQ